MSRNQLDLFTNNLSTLDEAIEMTTASLQAYGKKYHHWAIAFSGGKDSSAVVTLVAKLLLEGRIPQPKSLTIFYADTRMEIPPLQICALNILKRLQQLGFNTQLVLPRMEHRFFVYMFGRGVPPPKNRFRWCTPHLKIHPMLNALTDLRQQSGEKILMLTGVRMGESAMRDDRIRTSCGRDGAECGQGWFQETTPSSIADTLAPLLHWRVCHVWDWLSFFAADMGFDTAYIADVYGGELKTEINARTGCVGCNLASNDFALNRVLRLPRWQYLSPLKRLRPLYARLIKPISRLRKDGTERRKDGSLVKNPHRLGPLTIEARRQGLRTVLDIEDEVNYAARRQNQPEISLINIEELATIGRLIANNTWPDGWSGEEQRGDILMDQVLRDGSVQLYKLYFLSTIGGYL